MRNKNQVNNVLPKGKYIFLWGSLVGNAGGMTRAMLMRASMFSSNGCDVTVLCVGRGLLQRQIISDYITQGYNLSKVEFIFLEEYLSDKLSNKKSFAKENNELNFLSYEKLDNKTINYYNDGVLYARKCFNDLGGLDKIIYFDLSQQVSHTDFYFNNKKRGSAKNIFESNNITKQYKSYYAENGFCYMTVLSKKIDNGFEEGEVTIFSQIAYSVKRFKSMSDFREWYFSSFVNAFSNERLFVFCDPFLDIESGFRYMPENGNIYKIAISHGIGIGKPRCWNSQLNPRFTNTFLISPTIDCLVLLTEEALQDFSKRLGNRTNMYCLPNTINIPDKLPDCYKRDMKKVVFIGRFSPEKQCEHMVKAFEKVVKVIPDAKLYFYGRGDSYDSIKKVIDDLKLANNIILGEFTNDPYGVYQSSALSVSCSDFEGMALSVCESLANGCPVVAYNYKYGVQELISDTKNGYVVEKNNIDMLADKIIYHLQHLELLPMMGKEAYNSILKYSKDSYLDNWCKVLHNVVERRPLKNYISKMEFLISQADNKLNNKVSVTGIMKLTGNIPIESIGTEEIYLRMYNHDKSDYQIITASWGEFKNNTFTVNSTFENTPNIVSVCILWQNSFFEQELKINCNNETKESPKTVDNITNNDNKIIGNPKLVNSKIIFREKSKNNRIIFEDGITLQNSNIMFEGSNSIIYIRKNKHTLYLNVKIFESSVLYLGKDIYLNNILKLFALEHKNIIVGDDCLISYDVELRTSDPHLIVDIDTRERINYSGDILIGDHVWLGSNVSIFKNTHIGSGSIIGSKSLVSNINIPSNESHAGIPSRSIKKGVFFYGNAQHFTETDTAKYANYSVSDDKFIFKKDEKSYDFTELNKKLAPNISIEDKIAILKNLANTQNKNRFSI